MPQQVNSMICDQNNSWIPLKFNCYQPEIRFLLSMLKVEEEILVTFYNQVIRMAEDAGSTPQTYLFIHKCCLTC